MASLVDDFGVKIQNFVSEKTFTTKRKKVANNDFTGKKVFMRGQFTYFFFLEVSAKKRKTLEKKHGL